MASSNSTTSYATRTLPARAPDGFWRGNPRYFWYVLFAGTGLVLTAAGLVLLAGLRALGSFETWRAFLGLLASPPALALNFLLFAGILYFAIRFLWVGVKIPSVQLGPIPAPPPVLILVGHFGGLLTLSLAVLAIFSGVLR